MTLEELDREIDAITETWGRRVKMADWLHTQRLNRAEREYQEAVAAVYTRYHAYRLEASDPKGN
jgi:hypothetical protein